MNPSCKLPLAKDLELDATSRKSEAPLSGRMSSSPLSAAPLRILVVEDDALIGMLLGDMLTEMGHEVCAIESTEADAVAAAARHAPDMMIVDAQLREGSGLAAVDQILSHGYVPHVFVSGDLRGVQRLRPGAVAISKPFTDETLVQAVARARGMS